MTKILLSGTSGIALLFLVSCNEIKPVVLDASKSSFGSLKVSHTEDRLLYEASYTKTKGQDTLTLGNGGTNKDSIERLSNGTTNFYGPDSIKVNMDFSELNMAARYALVNKNRFKYRLGAAVNHQSVSNEFIGRSDHFSTNFNEINLWIDNEVSWSISDKLSLNLLVSLPLSQHNIADNSRDKLSLKYQVSNNFSVELGHYNYSVSSEKEPNISYEKIDCKSSGSASIPEYCLGEFSGNRSDLIQTFSGLGFTLGYNF